MYMYLFSEVFINGCILELLEQSLKEDVKKLDTILL